MVTCARVALVIRPLIFLLLLFAQPAYGAVKVAIVGDGSPGVRELEQRIFLDPTFQRSDVSTAQLFWVIGQAPQGPRWREILDRVRSGAGLVIIPGDQMPDLSTFEISARRREEERVTLRAVEAEADRPLGQQVQWSSAPQAGRRFRLLILPASTMTPAIQEDLSGAATLLTGRLGKGQVAVFSLTMGHPSNRELILWPYFNYMLYALSSELTGRAPVTFAAWPHSPIPGPRTLWILLAVFGLAWLGTVALFRFARRYSKRHPEIPAQFFKDVVAAKKTPAEKEASGDWRAIGFTRPLAGFLTLAGAMFVLFAPWYYMTNILIPNDIQPFPQAKGMWDFSFEALQVAWFLFDAGTYVAFVKYFAEYRRKDPEEAVRSAQFFAWWQILTGLVQVTAASIVAVVFLPHTRYGFSSTFVILVALGQYPGIFGLLNFFFQAYQRFDYNVALDLLSDWVLRFGLQIPFVLLFRSWGAANPEYGEAFGAAIGIGCGFYFSQVVTFAIATLLYRRLGLRLMPLFMAHFELPTAKRMLKYGLKLVVGKFFFRAAKTIDRVVISLLLLNYTEWLGLEGQIHYNLMFLFPIAYRFFETAMAALSESHGNGKPTLTQYYLARFFQVGSLYTAIGLSLLWALGPAFIQHAMDPQWARAADYILIAALIGAFYAPAWLSDMLQKGAGRPGLFSVVLAIEQVARIGLFWVLIPRYQFTGFYLALLITIALKVIGGWILNHLLIIKLRIFAWQMFAAPLIAGVANFALLRGVGSLLGLSSRWEVVLLFFAGGLVSFFSCFFVCGLAGGFDRAMAEELNQASRMTGPLRPLTRAFYHVARAGWSLSPLHDRFPVTIEKKAMEEARELQQKDS